MNLRKSTELAQPQPDSHKKSDFDIFLPLVQTSPIGFVIVNKTYQIQQVNPTFAHWFSASADSIKNRSLPELFSELWLFMEPQCQRAIRGDATLNQELKYSLNSNQVFTWLVSYTPILEKDVVAAIGLSITNISDRKELEYHREKELERASRLYNSLSRVNQAIALAQSREELFDKVTQVLVEQGGFPMAWIGWFSAETNSLVPVSKVGMETSQRAGLKISLDDKSRMSPTALAFNSNQPYICNDILNDPKISSWRAEYEKRGYKSSASFPIRENSKTAGVLSVYAFEPNFFKDKEVTLLAEATQDISFALENLAQGRARLRAETTAKDEKVFSESMIESVPGVLYFFDDKGKFLRWNKNFEKVSGYSTAEISRMHPLDFFSPDQKNLLADRIGLVFSNGESSVEADFLTKSGVKIPYFFTGKRLITNGLPCLVGLGVDVSDRRAAETALKELNESLELKVASRTKELQTALVRAESADRLKSAFLATMSHELRTPLNSIIGFTGIVLQKLAGPLNEEQSKQLTMVRGSARHLLELINDILDLSKIEAKQLEIKPTTFDLRATVEKTIELLKPMAEKKSLSLYAEIAPQISTWHSDCRRVEQILLNLINNAIKFTDSGQISVSVDFVESYLSPETTLPQTAVRIRVKDSGIGVRPEHLSALFQPFQQVDSGLSRHHEGTGLGLAICKRLVSILGGEIGVSSVWTKGSEFTVIIPNKEIPLV